MTVVPARLRRLDPRTPRAPHTQVYRRFRGPGPLTYVLLALLAVVSVFPLYWSFVVASHDSAAASSYRRC